MIYTVGLVALVVLGAGFFFKKEETVALLKSGVAWAAAVGLAAATYFDFDLSKYF